MSTSWFHSPLLSFNSLVLKDSGSRLVARDQPYGDHVRQRLDLYAPRRAGGGKLPVIVFFYGGSWNSGVKEGYGFAGRALAAQGFLVAIPDYRLVPEVRFPAFVEDGAAAVRWLVANAPSHGGDPERIVLIGHSAGAYNAAMLALDPRWLAPARARVKGLIGLAGPYRFHPHSGAAIRSAFGNHRPFGATQPIAFAAAGAPPALLLHGARDRTVSPGNSRDLASRLSSAGVEAEAKIYPELGHVSIVTAIALPFRGQAPVLADAAEFARSVSAPANSPAKSI
ncbi:MAG: alpha/beta hydrolase [Pseudomonadota bacterium]|nr:alpha/beta hydrolase [Pseudomonadota bacterium]